VISAPFHRLPFLRKCLTAVVIVDLLSFVFFVADARSAALAASRAITPFVELASKPVVAWLVAAIGVIAAAAFGSRPGRLWEGAVALGALALLSSVHAQLFGSPWRHLYFSGLCLAGWLLGLLVSRRQGAPTDESYARVGSIALLGAAYLNGGISKLAYGGVEWMSGLPIRAIVVAQDGLVRDSILSPYRSWVVMTPVVAGLFSVVTMGLELAGPLMLVGRRTRLLVALGLVAMHANIFLLTHILFWEAMVLLLLFGFSSDEQSLPLASGSRASILSDQRRFAGVAAFLTLCACLAIAHQSRRYARSQQLLALMPAPPGARPGSPPVAIPAPPTSPFTPTEPPTPTPPFTPTVVPTRTPTPTPVVFRKMGPFSVGQRLASGWSVAALDLSDDGFIVTLSTKRGRARFEVTCAASKGRGPFDLDKAHIFYWKDMSYSQLKSGGWAVRGQLQRATAGRGICDTVESWLAAAKAGLVR